MRSKGGDSHSTNSSETAALQKLGFDGRGTIQNVFASIVNRVRPSSAVLAILQELVSFLQILAIGFYSSIDGILQGSPYTDFLGVMFRRCLDVATFFPDRVNGNVYMMVIHMVILALWLLLFIVFVIRYNRSKTFSRAVIYLIYAVGYHVFNLNRIIVSTSVGFFARAMLEMEWHVDPVWCVFCIVFLIGYFMVSVFMLRVLQSSPDVDIKNRMCYWPQDFVPILYRMSIGYWLPFLMELLREMNATAELVMQIIIIAAGIGGIVVIWYKESNVFPMGRVVISLEYCVLMLAPTLSLIYKYFGGLSLWYFLAFVVGIVLLAILFYVIVSRRTKAKIDLLYSKFENLTANITSPENCICLFKTGIVFNVPCITNHTILNWAVARWPNHQPLMLMISFIFYVIHVPYSEILELVSVAADVCPLSVYDGLLFWQIFNRLPTRESQLKRKLDGIRRLYELPKNSLRSFWEAVHGRQWEESVYWCREFQEDLDTIEQMFSHLIFENPSSDCVMQEFIKFSMEIQGNYTAAYAAQKELARRGRLEESQQDGPVEGSVASMSQLSSTKSSLFQSDLSDSPDNVDVIHNGIQASVQARPYYSPIRILSWCVMTALISLVIIVTAYVFAEREGKMLDDQANLGSMIHSMANYLTTMFCSGLEFSTHNEQPQNTISGNAFNETHWRVIVNQLGNTFDDIFAGSFTPASSLPSSFTELWVTKELNTILLSPDIGKPATMNFVSILRLFQLRARTLTFSPTSYFGSIADPCPEILAMTYLYPAVCEVLSVMVSELAQTVQNETLNENNAVLFTTTIGMGINILYVFIAIPIICFGMFKEIDFMLAVYGSVPLKVVSAILNGCGDTSARDEAPLDQRRAIEQKRLLPSSMYRIWEVNGLLLVILAIVPIPAYLIYVVYKAHRRDALFVIEGIELSCQVTSKLGLIYLHAFRIVTGFTSPLTGDQELQQLERAYADFLEFYEDLYFGQTQLDSYSVVYTKAALNNADTPCQSLLGGGLINHSCSSFHSDVYFLYGHILRLMNMKDPHGIGLNSDWWRLFYPAIYAAIATTFNSTTESYAMISDPDARHQKYVAFLVIGVVLCILAIVCSSVFVKLRVVPEWRCFLHPIMVMDPEHISDSPLLLHFLQGDYDNPARKISQGSKRRNTATSLPLIDFLLEGVLVMTSEGLVIASNRKYHDMMANTEDEVVGFNIHDILPASCQPLFDALDRVRVGAATDQCVCLDTTIFTEGDREFPVSIHFAAQLGENDQGNRHTLCAMLFQDRSELAKSQALLRNEKNRVDVLLRRLLPPPVIKMIAAGKREISFNVQQACVLIANIVSFNSMCAQLSAKAVISTLNTVFNEFDSQLPRFTKVTKVKTMGDSYICVAGVFDSDGDLQSCAYELTEFAITMTSVMERLNHSQRPQIHLRIGVHTGGPLVLGVLGKDRPLFEVLGLPLAVADELQATCLHDRIHISQAYAKLIQNTNYKLTERKDNPKLQFLNAQKTFIVTS